jgi:transcriptional regulator with XRE-family HTH domain
MTTALARILEMDFPQRLAALRKAKSLTQQALADQVGVHVMQIRRYEGGASQPTLDVIRRLAIALSVSADTLLFDPEDRGPSDDLRLQFEAVSQFDAESRKVAKTVLDGLILQHQAKRLAAGSS